MDINKLGVFAVEEIKKYISTLFKESSVNILLNDNESISSGHNIVLATNFDLKDSIVAIPKLDEQDFYLKADKNTFYIIGGSYQATLWGVYELCEMWGVDFTLHGDVFPLEKKDIYFPKIDKVFKPVLKSRMWRFGSDLIPGPGLWSIQQHKTIISQIFKRKYNGIYFIMLPHFPYVNIEIDGVQQKTFAYNYGCDIPIDEDNIGKEFLGDSKRYINPEFVNCETPQQWLEKGKEFIDEVFNYARFFGMEITVRVDALFNIMKDFASVLEDPINVHQVGDLYISEGGDLCGDKNINYMKNVLETYIDSFPQVQRFCICAPEHPQSFQQFDKFWGILDKKYELGDKIKVFDIFKEDKRKEKEAKMAVSILGILHVFFDKTGLLKKMHRNGQRLVICPVITCPEILPIVNECLWPETDLILDLGYYSSDSQINFKYIDNIDFKGDVQISLTINDDNIGSYPQFTLRSASINIKYLTSRKLSGYYLRFWPIGDMEAISDFIAKASWDKNVVAETSLSNHISRIYGKNLVEPLIRAFDVMDKASYFLEKYPWSVSIFPTPDRISRSYIVKDNRTDRSKNKEVEIILSLFSEAEYILNSVYEKCSKAIGKVNIKYYISRMNFAIKTINGILRLFEVSNSLGKEENEEAKKYYEEACEYFIDALEGTKDNIRDESDKGTLAVYYHLFIRETKKKMKELVGDIYINS